MKITLKRSLLTATLIASSLLASQAMAVAVYIDQANIQWVKLSKDNVDLVKVKTGYAGTLPSDCPLSSTVGGVQFTLPSKFLSTTVTQATVDYAQTAYVTLLSALNNNRKVRLAVEKRASDGYCEVKEIAVYGD